MEIALHRQQSLAFQAPASEIVYGGAAGGGKSHLLRAGAIAWCMAVPGLQVYLFRRTHPELVANHLEGAGSFPILLAVLIGCGQAKIVGMEIRFANGSKIKLCHLQNRSALTKYQGAEIHVLMFDELTHFTDYEYRYLRGRCRLGTLRIPSGCPWVFPRIVSGTNPGGVGHHWVKAGWVDAGPYVVRRMPRAEGGMTRTFIPAQVADNPSLTENDPDYVEKLEGLGDPVLVRALLEGDWEIVAGSMFGDIWRPARHVCGSFPIPIDWKLWVGIDDGFMAPAAALWITQNPYTGTYYVVDELYRSGMLPEDFAERLLSRHYRIEREIAPGETELNSSPFRGIIDSAAYNETGGSAVSRGKQMAKRVRITPCEKWPGCRVDGVQNVHRLLRTNPRDPKKGPGIVFFDRCRESIRTIPALPRDDKDPEDVDTDAEDHAFDALRYGLQRRKSGMTRKRV